MAVQETTARLPVVIAIAIAVLSGSAVAQERDPWGVVGAPQELWIGLWAPDARGWYRDQIGPHAAIYEPLPGSRPAVVFSIDDSGHKGPLKAAALEVEGAKLAAGGVELEPLECPFRGLHATRVLAFSAPAKGCDALALTLSSGDSTVTLRFQRLSRRIKDAETLLAAWATELSGAAQDVAPLDTDAACVFRQVDEAARSVLLIRELARGERADGFPRAVAWAALRQTGFAQAYLERDPRFALCCKQGQQDAAIARALELWRKRGIKGWPEECPGSSKR